MENHLDLGLEIRALRSSLRDRRSGCHTPPEPQNVSLELIIRPSPPEPTPAASAAPPEQRILLSTRSSRAKSRDLISKALKELGEREEEEEGEKEEEEGGEETVEVKVEVAMEGKPKPPESFFGCNLCLEVATDPVITTCGHLFCWPCLHGPLQKHHHCPLCDGPIAPDHDVIPIYGRGIDDVERRHTDRREGVPPRPRAHRVESSRPQGPTRTLLPQLIEQIRTRTDMVLAAVNRLSRRGSAMAAEPSDGAAGSTTGRRGGASSDGLNLDGGDSRPRTRRRLS